MLAALLAASGCAVGPDYQAVPRTAPVAWQATESDNTLLTSVMSDDAQALARWWTWFEDDSLTALIEMALAQNLDVRAAEVRVLAARAERRAAQAGLGPQVGMGVASTRTQNPMPGIAPGLSFTLHEIGFDARWEIDLFGRRSVASKRRTRSSRPTRLRSMRR